MEEKIGVRKRYIFDSLLGQTWIYVLFMIIILCSAWMAAYPLVALHRYDNYKTIFWIGGIGLSIFLFIASIVVKNIKHNRFGMLSFLTLFSFVFPAILLIAQILFDIDRYIKQPIEKYLFYVWITLLWISYVLSILGFFLRRQKADFLLSLATFILISSQVVLPSLCKQSVRYYIMKHPSCNTNLKSLSMAYKTSCQYDQPACNQRNKWCDFLHQEWDVEFKRFICNEDTFGPCSYAMNKNIPADVKDLPSDLVLLFESTPGWNQTGGPEDAITNRHGKPGANIAFADGHVEFVPADKIPALRWTK